MINLMKADLFRILRKWTPYICMVLAILDIIVTIWSKKPEDSFEYLSMSVPNYFSGTGCPLFSLTAMLTVFGDELKAGTMQSVIGRGISRTKLVMAKFFDCMIIMGVQFLVMLICVFVTNSIFGMIVTGDDTVRIILSMLMRGLIPASAYIAIACFFIYTMWNTAVGVIAVLFLSVMMDLLVILAKSLMNFNLNVYWIQGIMQNSVSVFSSGGFDIFFFIGILLYIALPLYIAILIFRRKELDL